MSGIHTYGFQQRSSMPVCTPSRENCVTGLSGWAAHYADITDGLTIEKVRPRYANLVEAAQYELTAAQRPCPLQPLTLPSRSAQDAPGLPAGDDVIDAEWHWAVTPQMVERLR